MDWNEISMVGLYQTNWEIIEFWTPWERFPVVKIFTTSCYSRATKFNRITCLDQGTVYRGPNSPAQGTGSQRPNICYTHDLCAPTIVARATKFGMTTRTSFRGWPPSVPMGWGTPELKHHISEQKQLTLEQQNLTGW